MNFGPEINVETYLNSAPLRPPVVPSAESSVVGSAVVPQKGWGVLEGGCGGISGVIIGLSSFWS